MHDLALMGKKRCLYQLFFWIEFEKLGFLVDKCFKERIKITRIKLRGSRCDPARYIEMPDNLYTIHLGNLTSNCTLNVAAALNRQIDQHRTRTHGRNHFLGHKSRSRTAGNECCGNDYILLGNMVGNECSLFCLIFLRHFLGVTA